MLPEQVALCNDADAPGDEEKTHVCDQCFRCRIQRRGRGAVWLAAPQDKRGGKKEHPDHGARYRQMEDLADELADELATDEGRKRDQHSNLVENGVRLSEEAKGSLLQLEWLWERMAFARRGRPGASMDYFAAMTAFVRTADLGSFSKAAAEAGVKVSTVSRYVGALEADLGAALLNRSTRSLHLTEAGRGFYQHATQILAEVEDARGATRALNARAQGLLRINIPGAFGRRHVMPHMKDFLAAHPDIRLDATLTDAIVDLIEAGADVAVRIGALVNSTLVAKRLAPHRRVLVASPDYLAARSPLKAPVDLVHHECLPFALQPTGSWYCRRADEPGAVLVEVAVNGRLRANDSEALRGAALAGVGIALLPTWLVGDDLRAGRLVALLSECEWRIAPSQEPAIWAVYPPKKIVSPKVKAFLAFLAKRFGQPAYWDRP